MSEEYSGRILMSDSILSADGMSWGSMLGVAIALIIVGIALFWFLRRRGHMTFMRGGTNRQPRLAVLDAAAVDARRRLVLVRRDNVEHLILIGGPSDVVVESGIHRTKSVQADTANQPSSSKPAGRAPARAQQPRPQPKPPTPEAPIQKTPVQETRVQASPAATASIAAAATKPIEMEPLNLPKPDTPAPSARPAPDRFEATTDTRTEATASSSRADQQELSGASRPVPSAGRPHTRSPDHLSAAVPAGMVATAAAVPGSPKSAPSNFRNETKVRERDMTPDVTPNTTNEPENALDAAPEPIIPPLSVEQADAAPISKPPQDKSGADHPHGNPLTPPVAAEATPLEQSITADELIADFDKVLEAEINKAEERAIEETAAADVETGTPDAGKASLNDTAPESEAEQPTKTALPHWKTR